MKQVIILYSFSFISDDYIFYSYKNVYSEKKAKALFFMLSNQNEETESLIKSHKAWYSMFKIDGDPRTAPDENIYEDLCLIQNVKVLTDEGYLGAIEVSAFCGESVIISQDDLYLSIQNPPTFEMQQFGCPVCLKKYFELKSNS